MNQKAIQIGNSTGIIIPKPLLNKLGIKPGNEIVIEESLTEQSLIISKKGVAHSSITPDFIHLLNKFNTQYGKALKILAEK